MPNAATLTNVLILSALLLGISGCNNKADESAPKAESASQEKRSEQPAAQVPTTPDPFWPLAAQKLEGAQQSAQALNAQISELLLQPSHQALENTRDLWRSTSAQYEGLYLFTRLAVADPQRFGKLRDWHRNVAAWPIQPGYLDSFGVHAYSGLVFDIGLPISEAMLREQHGMHDLADATLGLYALEFLLFGERSLRGHMAFMPITGLSDTQKEQGYSSVDELPRNRRRSLVLLQSQLLAKDLESFLSYSQGVAATFNTLGEQERTKLIKQASHTMITEHLLAMAENSRGGMSDAETRLWSSQQLADRLLSQLQGLNDLLPLIFENNLNTVQQALNAYAEEVAKIAQLPPLGPQGTPSAVNWSEAHKAAKAMLQFFPFAPGSANEPGEDTELFNSDNSNNPEITPATTPDKTEP